MVDGEEDALREGGGLDMVAVGGAVEEGDGVGDGGGEAPARVVLEAEVEAVAERKELSAPPSCHRVVPLVPEIL